MLKRFAHFALKLVVFLMEENVAEAWTFVWIGFSCQVAGGGGVQRFPIGEILRDRIIGGSAKNNLY